MTFLFLLKSGLVIGRFQVGSGEVFGFDDPAIAMAEEAKKLEEEAAEEAEDEWQDIEVSEEWGPQTPMTPLNDDQDEMTMIRSRQQHQQQVCHCQCQEGHMT